MPRDIPPASALLLGLVLLAGCLGGGSPAETASPSPTDATATPEAAATTAATRTPLPDAVVSFPHGPKDRPTRPANLTAETVRGYVETHEYNYVYNTLWYGEATDVSLSCEVHAVEDVGVGYEAVVSCTGSSTTRGTTGPNETRTVTAMHADYFTQYRTYLLDEDSVVRREATEAERETARARSSHPSHRANRPSADPARSAGV